jgi:flavin-dependent dehydrogenase
MRPPLQGPWDAVVAGARVAGAATAMLLARQGARVLVVDPARPGSDTLSTHAIMRAGVLQLHRWGLLDRVRAAGTPRIEVTSFHYGSEEISIPIKPRDGIDGLYAPRRTVLDPILVGAAREAGAHVAHGWSAVGLLGGPPERVRGVRLRSADGSTIDVNTPLVIGADGMRSRIARLVGARTTRSIPHATATVYGYVPDLGIDAFAWHFGPERGMGTIPTNGGDTCVYAGMRPDHLLAGREHGLEALFHDTIRSLSPELAERIAERAAYTKLRAFAGAPTFLRESWGPGWALVGDAGYFKDPLTAHGITDALRDAELLALAAAEGTDAALAAYEARRDELSRGLMDVTGRIASLDWELGELQDLHRELSRQMQREVEEILGGHGFPGARQGVSATA